MEDYKKYFSFNGVATRSEYWACMAIVIIGTIAMIVLIASESAILILSALVLAIALIWYNIATSVRRVRDTGLPILWIIAFFLPYVAIIALFVFGFLPSAIPPRRGASALQALIKE